MAADGYDSNGNEIFDDDEEEEGSPEEEEEDFNEVLPIFMNFFLNFFSLSKV